MKKPSQNTLVRMMQALTTIPVQDCFQFLYQHDFPDWFATHAKSQYRFDWQSILVGLRNGSFFFPSHSYFSHNSITGQYLSQEDAKKLGERLIQRLAALAATLPDGEPVRNSLQLDGFQVNEENLELVPLEGPVSAQAEEDSLVVLVRGSGIANPQTVLQHIMDAHDLFLGGKYHPSLNESRNILQALIDDTSTETDRMGGYSVGLPGGTGNRIRYLGQVGFLTPDEEAAFRSAWGALSAGSHPGVPAREEARIGLILAIEFGQLLLLKFGNWKANNYKKFSVPEKNL